MAFSTNGGRGVVAVYQKGVGAMVSGLRINAAVQVTEEPAGLRVRLFELCDNGEAGPLVADVVCGRGAIALRSIVRQLAELGLRRAEHFREACREPKFESARTERRKAPARPAGFEESPA